MLRTCFSEGKGRLEIHLKSSFLFLLGFVHRRVCGTVNHCVNRLTVEEFLHGSGIGDIQCLVVSENEMKVRVLRGEGLQGIPQLSVRACYQDILHVSVY